VIPLLADARRIALLLAALLAIAGCAAGPELRIAGGPQTPGSMAEGRRLLDQGKAAEAVAAFRRQLREDGANLAVLNGLGIAYSELGRPDLAAEMFARALALAPDDAATLNNIGFAALRRADAPLARLYLEKARRQDGGLEKIDGNLARLALLEAQGRRRPAASALKQAAFHADDGSAAAVIRLPRPGRTSPPSAGSRRQAPQPAAPPSTDMIDFLAVTDPFAKRRQAE
jgi:Flp pilus assembly protein TadD